MTQNSTNLSRGLLLISIFLISTNLRPAIAAIGPLVSQIFADTNISSTMIGLLTMVPVFLMGIGAIYVRQLRVLFGERFGILLGTIMISLSCLARLWFPNNVGLLITATGAGMGIALIQSLMPGFAKRNFGDATGRVIGLYSTGIVAGASIAAGTAAGLSNVLDWTGTLAIWSLPSFAAILLWTIASQRAKSEQLPPSYSNETQSQRFWLSGRSWSLMIFFGVGTGAFMLVMAWIPPFYLGLGTERQHAGLLLSVLTIIEAFTALGVAAFIHHFPDRRSPLIFSLIVTALGFVTLYTHPIEFAMLAMALLGVGIGILFPLSIIVAIDHIEDPTLAGNFTSFVQGGGYIFASLVPLLAGILRDTLSDLSNIWLIMAAGSCLMITLAFNYSPQSYQHFRKSLISRTNGLPATTVK